METQVNGKSVFFSTGGAKFSNTERTIIFIHGAGMDRTVWSMQARFFAHHGFTVVNLDLPGHGKSEGPACTTIEEYSDWLCELIDFLDLYNVAMVGHSMGSLIALCGGAKLEKKIQKIALLGTLPKIEVHPDLLTSAMDNKHGAFETIVGWGVGRKAQIGGHKAPGSWIAGASMRLLEASKPGVLGNDLNACNLWEGGLESAGQIKCPALLLLGEDDRMTPPKGTKELAEALPNSETIILEGAGHMMMTEQPDQTIEILSNFFNNQIYSNS
tara:strand:+ start:1942 stop:2754 length:813 start_codon:yes stop_codon:yes gene_type:complete